MIKIGITGSLSSGKTTASKILSSNKGPLFCADSIVKKLYLKNSFKSKIEKKFAIKKNSNVKKVLKERILKEKLNIKELEKIIHPIVRKEMKKFINKNKSKKIIFFEIPLLIESKLMKHFDVILFIKASKQIRLKRFLNKGGSKKIFEILNKKQLSEEKKVKFSDHVIVNEKNKKILKRSLLDILELYE